MIDSAYSDQEETSSSSDFESSPKSIKTSKDFDIIAAALHYNNRTAAEGFAAIDVDKDGKLSFTDFKSSCITLQLNLQEAEMDAAFKFLDRKQTGYIPLESWVPAIESGHGAEVLRSLGVEADSVQVSSCSSQTLGERELLKSG